MCPACDRPARPTRGARTPTLSVPPANRRGQEGHVGTVPLPRPHRQLPPAGHSDSSRSSPAATCPLGSPKAGIAVARPRPHPRVAPLQPCDTPLAPHTPQPSPPRPSAAPARPTFPTGHRGPRPLARLSPDPSGTAAAGASHQPRRDGVHPAPARRPAPLRIYTAVRGPGGGAGGWAGGRAEERRPPARPSAAATARGAEKEAPADTSAPRARAAGPEGRGLRVTPPPANGGGAGRPPAQAPPPRRGPAPRADANAAPRGSGRVAAHGLAFSPEVSRGPEAGCRTAGAVVAKEARF